MHTQTGGGAANTDAHRGGGESGSAGGGGGSSYRTAKAEAGHVSTEVHGNKEHCLNVVDSSVSGCWATSGSHLPGWKLIPSVHTGHLQSQTTQESTPVHLSVCVCVCQCVLSPSHVWPASQPPVNVPVRLTSTPDWQSYWLMFHSVSTCKHATYTHSASCRRTAWPNVRWRQGNNKTKKKQTWELTSHQSHKRRKDFFCLYCTLNPHSLNWTPSCWRQGP